MMTNKIHRLPRPLLAAFVGATTTLAFAPYQIWLFSIITPLLLLLLIQNQSPKKAALIGFMWGLGQFAVGLSWVHISIDTFGGMPKVASLFLMLLLVSYLAIYPALFSALLNRFAPKANTLRLLLVSPALWLFTDLARGWIMTGFPWLLLGYSHLESPLANFAPIGGVQLITLNILIIVGAIAHSLLNRAWQWLSVPVMIFALGFALSFVNWVTEDESSQTSFALIQGNIAQEQKWKPSERWPTLMKYLELSQKNWQSDIIVWPEAAIPALEKSLPKFLSKVDQVAQENQTALITGVLTRNEAGRYYNNILALGDTPSGEYDYATQPRYAKHHLLPFGEFVPFEDILRPLAPLFNLPMSSFSRGDYVQNNIVAKGKHLAAALCYEIIFGEQVRANITEDTDFILTLSNDAWFGNSIGPLQHMEIAQMRALELGKPVIRATNNGVTAITDYKGHIVAELPQFQTDVLNASVSSTKGNTPYKVVGHWPTTFFMLIGLITAFLYRRKTAAL